METPIVYDVGCDCMIVIKNNGLYLNNQTFSKYLKHDSKEKKE